MASRNRTTAIRRPDSTVAAARAEGEARQRRNRQRLVDDLTTSIPRDKQLVEGRRKSWLLIPLTLTVTAAVVAALFVIPVRDWLAQDKALTERRAELDALNRANSELARENARLQTPEGIEQAAREEIGYVSPGENRKTVLPAPDAPLTLPSGWPFDAAAQILAVRSQPPTP